MKSFLSVMSRLGWLPIVSGLAIISLLLMQYSWLRQNRQLIEEQFDQKVTMALCSAIDDLGYCQNKLSSAPSVNCSMDFEPEEGTVLAAGIDRNLLEKTLFRALERYEIDLDFVFTLEPHVGVLCQKTPNCYHTPIQLAEATPTVHSDNHQLRVQFVGKQAYVNQRMSLMAGSSMLIALFVASLFGATLFQLSRQRRVHAETVAYFNQMAHEFRTPLTNIKLAISQWRKRNPDIAEDRYVRIVDGESTRMREQVKRVLDDGPDHRKCITLSRRRFDLSALLRQLSREMEVACEESGLKIRTDWMDRPYPISGDPHHLGNLLRNLISNAVRYNQGRPEISIRMERNVKNIRVAVRDNGIGVTEEQRDLIFSARHRGQPGTSEGYGLGLTYSRAVAREHGGDLWLAESSPHGSTFIFSLPQTDEV